MAVAVERAPSRAQRVFGETPTAWLWVTPAVVIILGLSLLPMAWALLLSFQHNDLVTPSTWIGLDNYRKLLDDATFFAASSLVDDVFVLTASFNIYFLRPISAGTMTARGTIVSRFGGQAGRITRNPRPAAAVARRSS